MKLGKIGLLVSAALLATSVQAHWEGEFLLGVSAGGSWGNNADSATLTVSDVGVFESRTIVNDDHDGRFIWGFLGGYQARCNALLLGLEVNVDWRTHDDDDTGTVVFVDPVLGGTTAATVSRDHNNFVVGITGRIGYQIANYFMPYIRLGVDHKEHNAFDFTVSNDVAPGFTVISSSDSNGHWGFVGGLGAEFPVLPCLALRAEWNYHSRHHGDDTLVAVAPNGTTVYTLSGDFPSHENTARLSLVYNFNI